MFASIAAVDIILFFLFVRSCATLLSCSFVPISIYSSVCVCWFESMHVKKRIVVLGLIRKHTIIVVE